MDDLTTIIKKILIEHEEIRDSDPKLICWVYTVTNPEILHLSFTKVMWNAKYYNLPSFETVRRTRQKLQHDIPELRGKLYEKRMEKQGEYIDKFARGVL